MQTCKPKIVQRNGTLLYISTLSEETHALQDVCHAYTAFQNKGNGSPVMKPVLRLVPFPPIKFCQLSCFFLVVMSRFCTRWWGAGQQSVPICGGQIKKYTRNGNGQRKTVRHQKQAEASDIYRVVILWWAKRQRSTRNGSIEKTGKKFSASVPL